MASRHERTCLPFDSAYFGLSLLRSLQSGELLTMPRKDRWGVTYYSKEETPPPKPRYVSRQTTQYGTEDMAYWQLWLRGLAVLAGIGILVLMLMIVGAWWDRNTYGYSDCVEDGMNEYFAEFGPEGAAFRPKVEGDCSAQHNR